MSRRSGTNISYILVNLSALVTIMGATVPFHLFTESSHGYYYEVFLHDVGIGIFRSATVVRLKKKDTELVQYECARRHGIRTDFNRVQV